MELSASTECAWPERAHRIEAGELLLLAQQQNRDGSVLLRLPLQTLQAGDTLPAWPAVAEPPLQYRIRALQQCRLDPCADSSEVAAAINTLISERWQQAMQRAERHNSSHQPLNGRSDQLLFQQLEGTLHPPQESSGDLQACIRVLL